VTDAPVDDTPASAPARDAQRSRRRRRRRLALAGVAVFAAVAAGVVVLPARTWVSQQIELRSSKAQLQQLEKSNAALSRRIDDLGSDGSIERQAREQFGLVYPGEEPYTVLASPPPSVNLPRAWPFDLLQDPLQRAAARQPAEGASVAGN
jgi:cell division protein FtsB